MMAADAERRFNILSTHLPVGVIMFGREAQILMCNPAALNLLGVTHDRLIGAAAFDSEWNVIHEDGTVFPLDSQPVAQAIRNRRQVGGIVIGIWRQLRNDRVWLEMHAIPILTDVGEVSEVICLFSDISERRRRRTIERRLEEAERELQEVPLAQAFPGGAAATLRLRDEIAEAARTLDDLPVLILGEPGTGKTLVAQTLHALSSRAAGRFEPVNCAGISATLFESEVFGHEKGSFTGATSSRAGRFELAHGGTLFLDEMGDLPLDQQAKLLVALQERSVRRVGGSADTAVDIAVIAATNHDLLRMVGEARFRADLYDRLNGFTIRVPPLRERGEDIEVLLNRFVRMASRRVHKTIRDVNADVLEAFRRYDWPGNVRQLDFVVRRMVGRAKDDQLAIDLVPQEILQAAKAGEAGPIEPPTNERIQEMLAAHEGNVRRTAERLRISRTRLYRLMEKHHITPRR